ncbi:MAG TPA: hypothetical protein VHG91_01610 [Longimicrobium sp.]|nr:hypothetical protein [Longimicrobium sp.]
MGKILVLVLVAAAAVVTIDPLRERVRPHMQFAFDPFYEWSTRNRVDEIKDMVKEEDQLGRPIPSARQFSAFLEQRDTHRDAAMDPWGTPYYLVKTRKGFRVGSAGRDMAQGTEDDILSVETPITTETRRRPGEKRRPGW